MTSIKNKKEKRTEGIQVGLSPKEKLYISLFSNKHNYKTVSKACRTLILDRIREIEHPELFENKKVELDLNPILTEIKKIQFETPEYIKKYISELEKTVEYFFANGEKLDFSERTLTMISMETPHVKQHEILYKLFRDNKTLSIEEILRKTGFSENLIIDLIIDAGIYELDFNKGVWRLK